MGAFTIKLPGLLIALVIMLSGMNVSTVQAAPYEGYTYSYWGKATDSPIAYLPSRIVTGQDAGIGQFVSPNDMFAASDGNVYLLDSGNGRIVVFDKEWKVVRQIKGFQRDGEPETFNNPEGLFVANNGSIYIADTENARIVELDNEGRFIREIGAPKAEVISEKFEYYPRKVVLDKAGRIYVVARGVYEGVVEFDVDGKFTGFMGANRVQFDPVDYFWKVVSTKEQREKMVQFVPIEFNNLDLDANGFIFTTTAEIKSEAPVKKLNPSGVDVLRKSEFFGPVGDLARERSVFTDIEVRENGVYSTLDSTRGRIFTYNEDGYLLYVFGQLGNQRGTFKNPVSVESANNRVMVLDRDTGTITEFAPTKFGKLVNEANRLYSGGKHDEAAKRWEQVLRLDANYEIAYVGIGKSLLRQGEYKQAMDYLELGYDREYYSKAFAKYRREFMREHFGQLMTSFIVLAAIWFAFRKGMKVRRERMKSNAA